MYPVYMRSRLPLLLTALALASCAPEAEQETTTHPNILFAIADDASHPYLSAYGTEWVNTPAFDRVAREGVLFNRAYTPNAKCAPSRAAILTGRNSWQLEQAGNHMAFFPAKFKSFMEALQENGYRAGKTHKGWGPGLALDADGQPRDIAGKAYDDRKLTPPADGISTTDYSANFIDFLDANTDGKPWAFWYGSVEPHRRYEYGAGVAKANKRLDQIKEVPSFWPDNEVVRNDMLDYAYEVEYFDMHLGRMLATLEERDQLENTLVVVTSDHGMPFPRVKGQQYERSNHIPLAMMWTARLPNPGRKVDDYVSFVDLAPTFLELAGIDWRVAGMQPTVGRSLTDILFSESGGQVNPDRDHVLIGKERHDVGRPHDWGYPIRGIYKKDMLYLRNFEVTRWPAGNPETGYLNVDGSPTKTEVLKSRKSDPEAKYWSLAFGKRGEEELYDLKADPYCMTNLADSPDHAAIKVELEEQLIEELKQQEDPRMFGNGKVFDEYLIHTEAMRGYYEKWEAGNPPRAGWVNESDYEDDLME